MIQQIHVADLRCFHESQSVALAPLTILVGENSTGKSTFLAAIRIAWDLFHGRASIDFNESPFRLGAFDQIANYRGGRSTRADAFSIGMSGAPSPHSGVQGPMDIRGTFREVDGQPALSRVDYNLDSWHIWITAIEHELGHRPQIRVQGPEADFSFRGMRGGYPERGIVPAISELMFMARVARGRALTDQLEIEGNEPTPTQVEKLSKLAMAIQLRSAATRPQALAPIRTTPQRTYDPTRDELSPEGVHVPMVLARLSLGEKDKWARLRQDLQDFGRASGLFNRISVRRLGGKQSAPFQIRVHIKGPEANLVDVGYGVTQVLPILVDCLRAGPKSTMLLQQPEVHLHPRAQAELGNFLLELAGFQGRQLIVETHSDYLLNRIRLLIRESPGDRRNPKNVRVLFFERKGTTVRIHAMAFDKYGNLRDAPPGYRAFFMAEERRFWAE